jgi:predicted aspartyl protease
MRRLIPLSAAAMLSACAGNTGPCTLGIAADVPITVENRAYFTDLGINGGLAHVRVDTGSAFNLLSEAAAERLHMSRQLVNGLSVRGVGGARAVNLAVSDFVQLGRAKGRHLAFITAATETFPPGTDGLLGMEFLSEFDDDLDFAAGHLRLVNTHGDCAALHTPLPDPTYAVPFRTISTGGSPVVDVQIDGKKFVAIIDSGATNSLLFRPAAHRLGLNVDALLAGNKIAIRGVGGATRATIGRLSKPVEIGELRISNLPMAIADQDSGTEIDMLLGYDFEKLVHLWISHSSKTLLMQYPARPTPLAR